MVDYAGKNVYLLTGIESTEGTPVATSKDIGVVNGITSNLINNTQDVREIGNRQKADIIAGNFEASISIDGNLNSGAIFELFFGQSTDTETTGDYRHTFIDADGSETLLDTASSFTLSTNMDSTTDIQHTYAGCKINSIDLKVPQDGVMTYSAEIFAASIASDASVDTQVTTTTAKLSGFQATLQTGDDASEATVGRVREVSVNFNNNLERVNEIGSRITAALVEKNFDVEVTFTKTFENDTEFQRFLGGTSQSASTPTDTTLILDVNNGVALGSGRVDFYLKMQEGQYETVDHTVSQDGLVEASFTYKGGIIQDCYFTDAVASYY